MVSILLQRPLDAPDLRPEPTGFALPQDTVRLEQHQRRVAGVEMAARGASVVQETPAVYTPSDLDAHLFLPAEQEEEQRRRLADRAALPAWRKIVDRFGLTPANLHDLVGVPIPDDTLAVDLESLTYTEASRILSAVRRGRSSRLPPP